MHGRLLLEHLAHRVEVDQLLGRNVDHEDTPVGHDLHQAGRCHPGQGLADGDDADVETSNEVGLVDAAPRRERSGDEHRPKTRHHFLGRGPLPRGGQVGLHGYHFYNLCDLSGQTQVKNSQYRRSDRGLERRSFYNISLSRRLGGESLARLRCKSAGTRAQSARTT